MARRKARIPQGKKIQPAPLTMTFAVVTPENYTATEQYIDLSQCASLINRRFYRQGLNWAVSGFTIGASVTTAGGSTNPTGSITICKVPQNWISANSWVKGFHAWSDMQEKALIDVESVKPKFNDFKVFLDHNHAVAGVDANLIPLAENFLDPLNPGAGSFKTGTWDMSNMIIPDDTIVGNTRDREIIWVGGNYAGNGASGLNSVSLIEGYASSRGLPDIRDPNVPADAGDSEGDTPENWIGALDNEGIDQDAEVLQDMITENIQAPYPYENDGTHTDTQYPGGANNGGGLELHYTQSVTSTTVGGLSTMPGGTFYGGLIKVKTQGDLTPGSHLLQVHLVPGSHRGYMCQAMQDV